MKTFLRILALAFPFFVNAQVKHELKYDAIGLFTNSGLPRYHQVRLFYELDTKSFLGFETDLSYTWDNAYITYRDSASAFGYYAEFFDVERLNVGITAKVYVSKKKYASGFFLGVYNAYGIETHREEAYKEIYTTAYNRTPKIYTLRNVVLGGSIGYKLLVLKRIIIEPNIRYGRNILYKNRSKSDIFSKDGNLFLKIGYRFGKDE